MDTGRVVQFDEARGYGFITPDRGGEDVFLHVNVLGNDRWSIAPGVPVEFESVDSGRGPKAMSVRLLTGVTTATTDAAASAGAGPANGVPIRTGNGAGNGPGNGADSGPGGGAGVVVSVAAAPRADDDEDVLCDVLPERALLAELTEMLLTTVPDLTAGQIVVLRREMLALARRHSWVED